MWSCWQHWHYVDNVETHLYGTLKHIHNLKCASCWRSCWWLRDPHPRSCKFIHNSSLWEIGYYLESMSFRTLASNLNSMPKLNTYECHLVVVDLLVDKIEYCVNHKQHRGPHEPRTRFSNVMDFFFTQICNMVFETFCICMCHLSVSTYEEKSPLGEDNSPAIWKITCNNEMCFRKIWNNVHIHGTLCIYRE